jgi:hypothetical protein
MTAAEAKEAIFTAVEEKTGYRVHVEYDAGLASMASTRSASHAAPFHLIRVGKSAPLAGRDYLAAFQCGFILRQAELSPELRFDIAQAYRGRKEVERLIKEHTKGRYPKEVRDKLRDQMHDGLMIQLRSVPIGLRIDRWISDVYPALADQQRLVIERQLQDNQMVLAPQYRELAPPAILNANLSMNAALAAFWGRAWNDGRLVAPYRAAGYAAAGEDLLKMWDGLPADPRVDRALIDVWARMLGIGDWYEVVTKA